MSNIRIGVVVDYKELPDGQILHKIRIPALHGYNVKDEDLPYIPMQISPGLSMATMTVGALDKGQLVRVRQDMGQYDTGYGTIESIYQPRISGDMSLPGNLSLSNRWIVPLMNEERDGVRRSPDIIETIENGVRVFETVESNTRFRLNQLNGFITHGAQAIFAAIETPAIQLDTAITGIASRASTILGAIQGTLFTIGNLRNLLTQAMRDSITENMPREVKEAFNTIIDNLRNFTPGGYGLGGNRVNMDVFTDNLVTEFSAVRTLDELYDTFDRIATDPEITGMGLLTEVTQNIQTAFGDVIQRVDAFGNRVVEVAETTTETIEAFRTIMGAINSSDGTLFDIVEDFGDKLNVLEVEVATEINQTIDTVRAALTFADEE